MREPLHRFVREHAVERCIILCDSNVAGQAHAVTQGLRGRIGMLSFRLGEGRKTLGTAAEVLEALARAGTDRRTTVVGVGGGVAGDLFGFAASTFMRGVPYIHVATSLVAMADAAIGAKTGVNLPAGKNLCGTFAEPIAVFAWIDALQTLPYRNLRDGLAEIVKCAIVEGDEFFEALENLAPHPFVRWPWETVVSYAQQVKTAIVNDDRHERGMRQLLNLGHTFGHAIESASGYRVSHGAGVSIGLRAAGLLALRTGRFSERDHLRVLALLALLKLPATTREQPKRVFAAMQSDKKKTGRALRFVLPRAIGDVEYGVRVRTDSVRAVLEKLQAAPGGDEFR